MIRKDDLGIPIFNLNVELTFNYGEFCEEIITPSTKFSLIDKIEKYGVGCNVAKKLFQGQKNVTKKGYLLTGWAKGKNFELETVTLDIARCAEALVTLDMILRGEIKDEGLFPMVHLRMKGGGPLCYTVNSEGPNLYLVEIRKR